MSLNRPFRIRLALVILALALSGLRTNALADDSLKIKLVVPTIDFPATGVSGTRIFGINNLGNLSIEVFFSDGSEKVATRINGHYSTPSQPPNTNLIASANGLNNFNVVVGYYLDSTANTDRGFILKNGSYTAFDVSAPGASLLPAVEDLRASSATTAVAVAQAAAADGVATRKPDNLVQAAQDAMWQPVYPDGAT